MARAYACVKEGVTKKGTNESSAAAISRRARHLHGGRHKRQPHLAGAETRCHGKPSLCTSCRVPPGGRPASLSLLDLVPPASTRGEVGVRVGPPRPRLSPSPPAHTLSSHPPPPLQRNTQNSQAADRRDGMATKRAMSAAAAAQFTSTLRARTTRLSTKSTMS